MAASSSRSGYHQDYSARIRYSNALPPPPNPPKLLNIPGTGLANGQYTSAAYASKLARERPLNIEADGELGMPIDLLGLPGVFDGNESVIHSIEPAPQPHPHDRPLLRPVTQLGKAAAVNQGVSFLRRTEYISSDQGLRSRLEGSTPRDLTRRKQEDRKRKRAEVERDDDPVKILRGIYKGFDIAYPHDANTGPDSDTNVKAAEISADDRMAWEKPRHPTNPDLVALDTYPLLPDIGTFPDSGTWFTIKFMTNPSAKADSYDSRLDTTILRPLDPDPEVTAQREAQRRAYESDKTLPPPGPVPYDYEIFLPEEGTDIGAVKGMFDVNDPSKHDATFYKEENLETGRRSFRYKRVGAYETAIQAESTGDPYGDIIALAIHDPEDAVVSEDSKKPARKQKAAYFYPITQRTSIRPRRKVMAGTAAPIRDEGVKIDFLDVAVADPDEEDNTHTTQLKTEDDEPAMAMTE